MGIHGLFKGRITWMIGPIDIIQYVCGKPNLKFSSFVADGDVGHAVKPRHTLTRKPRDRHFEPDTSSTTVLRYELHASRFERKLKLTEVPVIRNVGVSLEVRDCFL